MKKLQALENALNSNELDGLRVREKYFEDKRKTQKKYYVTFNETIISPVLEYDKMNHFILGFNRANEILSEAKN